MPSRPSVISFSGANGTLHTWHLPEAPPHITRSNINLPSSHALLPTSEGVILLHKTSAGVHLVTYPPSGAPIRTSLPDPYCHCLALSSVFLAIGTTHGKVRIWNTFGTLVAEFLAHWKGIACMAFSDDAEVLVTGGLDGAVKVFCVADCVAMGKEDVECRITLEGHMLPVSCLALGYGGTSGRVVTGGRDGWVKVWHMGSQRCVGSWRVGGRVKALQMGEGEGLLYVGCDNGDVKVLEVADVVEGGVLGQVISLKGSEGASVSSMAVGGGYVVVGYEGGGIRVFDEATRVLVGTYNRHGSGSVDALVVDEGLTTINMWSGVLGRTRHEGGVHDFYVEAGQREELSRSVEEVCQMAIQVSFDSHEEGTGEDMLKREVMELRRKIAALETSGTQLINYCAEILGEENGGGQ